MTLNHYSPPSRYMQRKHWLLIAVIMLVVMATLFAWSTAARAAIMSL